MDVLFDALFAIVAAGSGGWRRRTRPRRPFVPIADSPWLTVAVAAVAAEIVLVGVAAAIAGRAVLAFLHDDLLFFLGLLLFPIAVGGVIVGLTFLVWLVTVLVKLVRCDGSARLELGLCGAIGLLAVAWIGWALPLAVAVVAAAPPAMALVVTAVPDAWRPSGDPQP